MKHIVTISLLLTVAMASAGVADSAGELSFGGDLRFRQTTFDHVPLRHGGTLDWSFLRTRPRLWAQYQITDNTLVRARFTNEFRKWYRPAARDQYEFPSETMVDNLYLDIRGMAGGSLDLRIGRQDLIYGTGKIILDGTPGDGSRTIYFDAVKATWKGFSNMTLDLLGLYCFAENPLLINGEDINLTNLTGQDVNMEADELGVGVYLRHEGLKGNWPFEAYYLFKQEAEFTLVGGDKHPSVEYSTLGVRIMPRFSERLTGNLEMAYQLGSSGDRDLSGYMLDAKVNMELGAVGRLQPRLSAGLYVLSGNDPATADDEAWRPPFARWPQNSELYIYAYAADRSSVADWQNLVLPYLECSTPLGGKITSTALVGHMSAMEKDGPDPTGRARGLLLTWWNRFNLAEGLVLERDAISGHLLLETVRPGSYYTVDDASTWVRWEFIYSF